MEELFIYALLLQYGLTDREEYLQRLDALFLIKDSDDCLLELEFCTNNSKKSLSLLMEYWEQAVRPLHAEKFGKPLFEGLEKAYRQNILPFREFASRVYGIWRALPQDISMEEPFWKLSYIDDCLSWGDESQARELYQETFCFYQ